MVYPAWVIFWVRNLAMDQWYSARNQWYSAYTEQNQGNIRYTEQNQG